MSRAAAKTGIMPMALVAIEQSFPRDRRVVQDDLAYHMLPWWGRAFARALRPRWARDWTVAQSERSHPGLWGGLLCRKRYIDERLSAATGDVEAVVNLGGGFDTRAFRLTGPAGPPVWELDQRETVEAKSRRVRRLLGGIPAHVHFVPIDFDRDDPGAALTARGYAPAMRTFFIWEAVTQYLTEPGVRATLRFLAAAAPGSLLAFTYVRRGFLEGRTLYGWKAGYDRFVRRGTWLWGVEPADVPELLAPYGWTVVDDVGYESLADRYLAPTGRRLTATAVERMVYARKVSTV